MTPQETKAVKELLMITIAITKRGNGKCTAMESKREMNCVKTLGLENDAEIKRILEIE